MVTTKRKHRKSTRYALWEARCHRCGKVTQEKSHRQTIHRQMVNHLTKRHLLIKSHAEKEAAWLKGK